MKKSKCKCKCKKISFRKLWNKFKSCLLTKFGNSWMVRVPILVLSIFHLLTGALVLAGFSTVTEDYNYISQEKLVVLPFVNAVINLAFGYTLYYWLGLVILIPTAAQMVLLCEATDDLYALNVAVREINRMIRAKQAEEDPLQHLQRQLFRIGRKLWTSKTMHMMSLTPPQAVFDMFDRWLADGEYRDKNNSIEMRSCMLLACGITTGLATLYLAILYINQPWFNSNNRQQKHQVKKENKKNEKKDKKSKNKETKKKKKSGQKSKQKIKQFFTCKKKKTKKKSKKYSGNV